MFPWPEVRGRIERVRVLGVDRAGLAESAVVGLVDLVAAGVVVVAALAVVALVVTVELGMDLILIFLFGGSGGVTGASCPASCSASASWIVLHICSFDPDIASISSIAVAAPAVVSPLATRIVVACSTSSIVEPVSAYIVFVGEDAGSFLVFCPGLEMIGGFVFNRNLVMRVVLPVGAIADSSQDLIWMIVRIYCWWLAISKGCRV